MNETSHRASAAGAASAAPSISAVVVTRNRLSLLQECLAAVRSQSRPPDEILVIDNGSDDGTREWLGSQEGLTIIHQGNVGGAGGFHRGIKESYYRGHDWFWCMDDDTIPAPEALERLCAAPAFERPDTGFLGSLVTWTDGTAHKMNMWFSANYVTANNASWYGNLLRDKCVPVQTSSFVSILISRRAVQKVGLPIREFFIWCDDAEFTHRVSKYFRNYHVLDSIVLHKTAANKNGSLESVTPQDYFKLSYGLRNEIYFRRVQKGRPVIKSLRILFYVARQTLVLAKARAPFFLVRSLWSGLFFRPRIERVPAKMPSGRPLGATQGPST